MALIFTVTDAGRAALVNAAGNGTNAVLIATAGLSSTAIVPDRTMTALPGQFKTLATLSGAGVADDLIHLIIRDESNAVFTLRSVGLYLADGTLFGIYGQAEPIIEKTAASLMLLEMNIQFADIAADSVTFGDANFLNPPATETTMGIAALATQAQSDAGTDDQRIVTPKKMRTSVFAWVASWFSDVWRASNDGSGSGLDADLLDGQHGSWYADIKARLGFTPLNAAGGILSGILTLQKAGSQEIRFNGGAAPAWRLISENNGVTSGAMTLQFSNDNFVTSFANALVAQPSGGLQFSVAPTVQGNIVWHGGNDGSGSGLDADLLDGQDGSWYSNIPARLGFTPVNRAGDTLSGPLSVDTGNGIARMNSDGTLMSALAGNAAGRVILGTSGDRQLYADAGSYHLPNAPLFSNGGLTWTSANDGSGSGLDADLLDGLHGADYAKLAEFASAQGNNGYVRLPGGLILQWINVSNGTSNAAPFSWPIPFPNAVFAAVPGSRQGLTFSGSHSVYLNNVTTAGGSLWSNNGSNTITTSCIIAIGN